MPGINPAGLEVRVRYSAAFILDFSELCGCTLRSRAAHQRRSETDWGEYRQAAGAFAEAVIRSVEVCRKADAAAHYPI